MKKLSSVKILLLFILLGLLVPPMANAQLRPSPAIMAQINAELQKRGLTEAEVRVRLIQKGIDVENIPIDQLPKYKDQIIATLDELQAEKAAKNAALQQPGVAPGPVQALPQGAVTAPNGAQVVGIVPAQTVMPNNVVATDTISKVAGKTVQPVTTPQEAAAEAGQRGIQKDEAKKGGGANIYGHSLFTDKSLDVFRTSDGAQAPDTYVLGEGDEIRITIFGASQTDIQQKINNEGYIQPVGTAKIYLKGLTLAQGREIIENRLSTAYTFRPDQFAVTIVTARTVLVNVFGEAKITGGFSISALNSAFNALSAAGGPTAIGSVRNIQHIRGNSKSNIDLYAFMNNPTVQYKFDLQQNDILFVPVSSSLVTIEGAVKRPMTYEMLPEETLIDLIKFAGDVRTDVYPDFVQIKRYANGEEVLKEWNLADVRAGKIKVPIQNGDSIRIKTIGKPMTAFVEVSGSVYYPGKYDLSSNPSLASVLEKAKPNLQAKTDLVFVERTRSDETTEYLSVPFSSANGSKVDFKLQARDRIRILDLTTYRDVASIQVSGQVRNPFEKSFALNDKLTVRQAIDMAGGLKTSVYPVAYIFRKNLFNPSKTSYLRVDLGKAGEVWLQPGDQLNLYDNSTYTNIGEVKISGAVKTPHGFTFDPSLTLQDVLTNVGGLTISAARNRIEVFRTILSPTEKVRIEKLTLEVDSTYKITNQSGFSLQPYDYIVVRQTPEFAIGRTVELNGQVAYPGTYPLESKEVNLSEIIKMAGGLLPDADPIGSSLYRTFRKRGSVTMNVSKALTRSKNIKFDPILFEGDVININRRENVVKIQEPGTRMSQYTTSPDSTGAKLIVFQGRASAKWYIRHFAGGFLKDADKNSVVVTLPNNQMRATKKYFLYRIYPRVEPGSVITLRLKPPVVPDLNGKKGMDWDTFFARTLSATTALVALMVLAKQL